MRLPPRRPVPSGAAPDPDVAAARRLSLDEGDRGRLPGTREWRWHRVAIVGPPAAGKSLLAAVLRDRVGLRHVELDRLRYTEHGTAADADFALELAAATEADERWVMEGAETSPWVIDAWRRADLVVWLDHGRPAISCRMLQDCMGALLWGAPRGRLLYCRYQLRKLRAVLGHITSQRRALPARLADVQRTGRAVVRLPSRRSTRRWLDECLPGGGRGAVI